MLINAPCFHRKVRKDRKTWAFYFIYLRRHVKLNLRSSAFICGFGKPGQVILTDTSARIASSRASKKATNWYEMKRTPVA
jgi:hypothetical protein